VPATGTAQAVVLAALVLVLPLPASPVDYYVSPSGNDGNPGTLASPFLTIGRSANAAQAGDTVYIRSGVYSEGVHFTRSGTAAAPIRVRAYPQETPVVDGNGHTVPGGPWDVLVGVSGDHVQIYGIEVRYSSGMGVTLGGKYDLADGLNSHHHQQNGILVVGAGDHSVVQNCRVWSNCMTNVDGGSTDGWASGLSAARQPTGAVIRGNVVYGNWGEGLSTYEAQGTLIEDNVVYDNWSANVYISDALDVLFQRNLVYATGNTVYASGTQVGVMLGDEKQTLGPSQRNTVVNNLVVGTRRNFYWWRNSIFAVDGMRDDLVAYNTFVNSRYFSDVVIATSPDHLNTRFVNNLMVQEDALPTGYIASNIQVGNNLWTKAPVTGSGPGDVIGDPQLAKVGTVTPGQLTADYFIISRTSPAKDRALPIAEVSEDYFRSPRGARPDIGADEVDDTPPAAPRNLRR
jgi:hypothetical protein